MRLNSTPGGVSRGIRGIRGDDNDTDTSLHPKLFVMFLLATFLRAVTLSFKRHDQKTDVLRRAHKIPSRLIKRIERKSEIVSNARARGERSSY